MKQTSTSKPILTIRNHRLILTNIGKKQTDKWKWIFVTGESGKREVSKLDLKGLKVKVIPMKLRNKIARVLKKYIQGDGFIYKEDIEKIQNELSTIKEDVLDKIDWMEGFLR